MHNFKLNSISNYLITLIACNFRYVFPSGFSEILKQFKLYKIKFFTYLAPLFSNQLSKLATVGGLWIILLLLSSKKIVGELDT